MRLLSLFISAVFFLTAMAFADATFTYKEAVMAYRQGQTQEAFAKFSALAAEQPKHTEARYYLAMTQARLGQVDEARASYQEVLRLAPSSEAAKLAQLGLSYLPASTQALDAPPQIGQEAKSSESQAKPAATGIGGMDSQAMQMMMMMSAMGGGGKGGGNSMMMLPLLQQMTGGGGEKIPPETMQLMMQQQMMPDMNSLFDSKNDN